MYPETPSGPESKVQPLKFQGRIKVQSTSFSVGSHWALRLDPFLDLEPLEFEPFPRLSSSPLPFNTSWCYGTLRFATMTTDPAPQQHAAFRTTRWTRVCLAKSNSDEGRMALADLCDAYYEPVVAYLRRVLRDADAAR